MKSKARFLDVFISKKRSRSIEVISEPKHGITSTKRSKVPRHLPGIMLSLVVLLSGIFQIGHYDLDDIKAIPDCFPLSTGGPSDCPPAIRLNPPEGMRVNHLSMV